MDNLLIFGCGYTGLAIAKAWQAAHDGEVFGTTRTRDAELIASDVTPVSIEDHDKILKLIGEVSAIIISTPPPDPALAYASAIAESPAWLGYLSTTAVYGDQQGAWVDESTPPQPTSKRGQERLDAERAWQETVPRANIFRLAGIYGAGCGPFEKIRAGRAQKIIKEGQVFGRIHVEDITRIVLQSYKMGDQGEIYSLTDDEPVAPEIVLDYAAQKLGLPPLQPVQFDQAVLSPMARSFYEESKRVRNDRIRARFGALLYPDYRSGLDAIYTQEEQIAKS